MRPALAVLAAWVCACACAGAACKSEPPPHLAEKQRKQAAVSEACEAGDLAACVHHSVKLPHDEAIALLARGCGKDHAESCVNEAFLRARRAVGDDDARARALARTYCPRDARSCAEFGNLLSLGTADEARARRATATAFLAPACHEAQTVACADLTRARMDLPSPRLDAPERRRLDTMLNDAPAEAACDMGHPIGCVLTAVAPRAVLRTRLAACGPDGAAAHCLTVAAALWQHADTRAEGDAWLADSCQRMPTPCRQLAEAIEQAAAFGGDAELAVRLRAAAPTEPASAPTPSSRRDALTPP